MGERMFIKSWLFFFLDLGWNYQSRNHVLIGRASAKRCHAVKPHLWIQTPKRMLAKANLENKEKMAWIGAGAFVCPA